MRRRRLLRGQGQLRVRRYSVHLSAAAVCSQGHSLLFLDASVVAMNTLLYYIVLFSLALAIHGLFFQFDLVSLYLYLRSVTRSMHANQPRDERFVV